MIEVSKLTKVFGPHIAINDLSFSIQEGEIVGFLGPNGAGKSTTMKILTGFTPATQGTARVAGHDVYENPMDVKRNVGYLPETPPVYFDMRVDDYLDYASRLHEVPKNKRNQAIDHAIEKTKIGDVRNRLIGNLSKGYKQRVGLAQAILHNPKVLILDEPTVGLDPKQIIEIRELIKGLGGDHTVILSSHILPEVTATCQRIIVINKGQIVAQDSIEQLTARLNKGLIYNLQLSRSNDEGIAAIRTLHGVKSLTQAGSKLVVEIEPDADQVREKIVATAVQKDMGVLEFSSEKASLEDIFLQLTTEESAS